MSSPATFLRAFARQLSSASLYGPAHPMLARGLESAFEELRALPESDDGGDVVFEIRADAVLCDGKEVTDLGAGPWRAKLRDAGVERLSFDAGMDAPAFVRRFHELAVELGLYDASLVESEDIELEVVSLDSQEKAPATPESAPSTEAAGGTAEAAVDTTGAAVESLEAAVETVGVAVESAEADEMRPVVPRDGQDLDDLADLVHWIHGEIARTGRLPSPETVRVVESLRSVAAAGELGPMSPRLLAPTDEYTTSHCLNVALLATALAAHLEYDDEELDLVMEAALLHDIGKVRLPLEDSSPDGLTPEQRSVMEQHPAEGARILLAGPVRHTLSAVVAYEHHMPFQGESGYPARHYPRSAHRFSRLVQICDAYDVLRSERGFRRSLSHEGALEYMRLQASVAFDPDLVTAFTDLCGARALPRIPDPDADERELGSLEQLSRMPDGAFDADTEIPPIRL